MKVTSDHVLKTWCTSATDGTAARKAPDPLRTLQFNQMLFNWKYYIRLCWNWCSLCVALSPLMQVSLSSVLYTLPVSSSFDIDIVDVTYLLSQVMWEDTNLFLNFYYYHFSWETSHRKADSNMWTNHPKTFQIHTNASISQSTLSHKIYQIFIFHWRRDLLLLIHTAEYLRPRAWKFRRHLTWQWKSPAALSLFSKSKTVCAGKRLCASCKSSDPRLPKRLKQLSSLNSCSVTAERSAEDFCLYAWRFLFSMWESVSVTSAPQLLKTQRGWRALTHGCEYVAAALNLCGI